MFLTKDNLNIFLSEVKRDPRYPKHVHIIDSRDATFCFCKKRAKAQKYVIVARTNLFKILLHLGLVCARCERLHNEFLCGDCRARG